MGQSWGVGNGGVGADVHWHVQARPRFGCNYLRLPAFSRRTAALQGWGGGACEEADDTMRLLRAGVVSVWAWLYTLATLCWLLPDSGYMSRVTSAQTEAAATLTARGRQQRW